MSVELLTRDNPSLSRPITDPLSGGDCHQLHSPPLASVAAYVRGSLAENTRNAYAADLAHFEGWGGSMPASDQLIASYLAAHAEVLSVATLSRRLASLTKAHDVAGCASPTRSALVKATLRGIKRRRGTAQRQA